MCSTYLAARILGVWYRTSRNVSSYIVGATSGGDMLLAVSDTGTLGLGRKAVSETSTTSHACAYLYSVFPMMAVEYGG